MSQRFRHNLNRGIRALTSPGAGTFSYATSPAAVKETLAALRTMHAARWGARGLPSRYMDETYFGFHSEVCSRMLPKDRIRLYSLVADGVWLAILYCYQYKRHTYYYSGSFDTTSVHTKHSPGNVARALAIRHAID
jgi:CelD/BcsL family acetyltransferase involved in cellulose biosynthesis